MVSVPQRVALTANEQALFDKITYDPSGSFEARRASIDSAEHLARSLFQRGAIPDIRRRYFMEPEFFPGGRGKSHMNVFERNFIEGPSLPTRTVAQFCAVVDSLGSVSGDDILELRNLVRRLTRESELNPYDASEEFFKLALECGASAAIAGSLLRAVREVRT